MIIRKLLFILFAFILSIPAFSQYSFYVIKGSVSDNTTKVELKKAQVYISKYNKTFYTDKKGQFQFALPPGKCEFTIILDEYKTKQISLDLKRDTVMNITIESEERNILLEEIQVIANRKVDVAKSAPGLTTLSRKDILSIPSLGGEKDIVKTLQSLPGVQQAYEGSANLIVRGGAPDQNLYLLDGVHVYNTNHVFGLLSSYNQAIIKSVDFYRGGFPAKYGGFVSSILNVTTKDYLSSKLEGSVDIGIFSGSAYLCVPLFDTTANLILSGRRTFLDLFSKIGSETGSIPYSFSDYAAKFIYIKNKHQISTGFYYSRDAMVQNKQVKINQTVGSKSDNNWGTKVFTLNDLYSINSKLSNNIQLFYTDYNLISEEEYKGEKESANFSGSLRSSIASIGLSDVLKFSILDSSSLSSGVNVSYNMLDPATLRGNNSSTNIVHHYVPLQEMLEVGSFLEASIKLPMGIIVTPGIRNDMYRIQNTISNYQQVRLALQKKIIQNNYLKLSYTQTVQPMHQLTNASLGPPLDLWFASNKTFVPQRANQYTIGYYTLIQGYTFTIEYFNKQTRNNISYQDGHGAFDVIRSYSDKSLMLENAITQGTGRSSGLEFFADKNFKNFSGWISYTLSWAYNKFPLLDNNKEFFSPYDRRHVLNIKCSYSFNKLWKGNFNFQFMSGQPITMPRYYYIVNNNNLANNPTNIHDPTLIWGYGERNELRMKAVHHLDVSVSRKILYKKYTGYVELGCYNVYNRKNPFYYYGKLNYSESGSYASITSVSLFPAIPYLSVKIDL